MRTMNFCASGEPDQLARAGNLAIAALVHILALVLVFNFQQVRIGAVHDEQGAPARFFVDVSLARLAPPPQAAPAPVAVAAVVATATATAIVSDAPPGPLEVLVTARAAPEAIRMPLAPASTSEAARADPQPASLDAAPARTDAPVQPAPVSIESEQRGIVDDTPKVIGIESMGMSSATYTFPALTGERGNAKAHVFKVDIGRYRDIELAIVNHVIEQIRARYPDEITWDSKVRNGKVRLSMRIEDHAELEKFLRIELFGKKKSTTY